MLKMKWWTVAFLCQVLQEPWNFQSRQGRHPHNFQSDTDRVVFGMAADCFRISNFTLWLHGVYVARAVIETAHTIMNGKRYRNIWSWVVQIKYSQRTICHLPLLEDPVKGVILWFMWLHKVNTQVTRRWMMYKMIFLTCMSIPGIKKFNFW